MLVGKTQILLSFNDPDAISVHIDAARLSQFDDAMMATPREPMTIAQLKRHIDRRFATKRDLRRLATKKDLQRFATRKELRQYATKKDVLNAMAETRRHFDVVAENLEEKLRIVAEGVAEMSAIKLQLVHHGKALDDHEVRITAIERTVVS